MIKAIIKANMLCFLLLSFILTEVNGQRWKLRRYEAGFGIGTIQIFGDIGGTADKNNLFGLKDINFSENNLALTGRMRYKINTSMSVKAVLNYGRGQGTDAGSKNDRGRSYKTSLFEFSGHYEYYFLKEDKRYRSAAIYSRKGMLNNYSSFAAYMFIGAGVTLSKSTHGTATVLPQDDYKETRVIAPAIPFGIGVKYIIDDRLFINGDLGYRYSLSDYLDGYKQAWNSKYNDVYYFLLISVNYRLKTTRRGWPAFVDWKYKRYGY